MRKDKKGDVKISLFKEIIKKYKKNLRVGHHKNHWVLISSFEVYESAV